ncbi:alpha/beta fold hydrolase [Komagataeibacter sp. FNDCF1]|uniref:alpha/beta fold hydrolase n=1 Tax=Komagataeibacter sp. FNDCF1 TaxID=2878681 RepID=UPI001E3053A7|nr:alpha/beta hydrolase [Komagataeibacter sp. FNDCF1]MCE2565123.1 alpha/beta hydrolase [Komagataeibacter sp. FNDCF1]
MQSVRKTFRFIMAVMVMAGTLGLSAPGRAADLSAAAMDRYDHQKKQMVLGPDMTLSYIEMGPRDGIPVVLIHGYTDSARDWEPLVPELSRRFHLIIPDLRGHGASSKPDCCYAVIDFAHDIRRLLDGLHIPRAMLVGHSLGSIVVQSFAENWPEHTQKVVLISSTGGRVDCPTGEQRKARAEGMDFRTPITRLHDPIDPDSAFMKEWWSSPTPVPAAFLDRQRHDAAAMPAKVWLAVLDQGLMALDVRPGLAHLHEPALLIWGEKDPIMLPEVRTTLIAALPQARTVIFPGLGHNPFWEDPHGVAREINHFIQAK